MTDLDRGKDFEPDIYATHEEDYDDFDVEEEEEGGSRAAIILLVVIGVVLLLGVAYVSYRMGYENGQREASVPRLQATAQGGKVQPDNPGGLAQPQESALDESITSENEKEFAQLLPNEEEVIDLGNNGGDSAAAPGIEVPEVIGEGPDMASMEPVDAPDSVPVDASPPKPAPAKPKPAAPKPETSSRIMVPKPGSAPSSVSSPSGAGTSGSTSVPSPTIPAPSSSASTLVPAPPSASIPAPSPAAPSGPAPAAGPSGEYVVQLASLPSLEAADAAWRNTSVKYSDLLGSAVRDIEEADLGERGIFYRLRVGYYESRTEANRLCETLKSRGQDCLVKSR